MVETEASQVLFHLRRVKSVQKGMLIKGGGTITRAIPDFCPVRVPRRLDPTSDTLLSNRTNPTLMAKIPPDPRP